METTLSLLSQFPTNKSSRELFIKRTKDMILSGERNPLEFATYLAAMEKIVKELRQDKDIEDATLNELAKHGKKSIELYGAKFTESETGVDYDYSMNINWNMLSKIVTEAKEKQKQYEDFLKTLEGKTILVDEKTGETTECYPPIKTSKTKVTVTLK
jgi:hypothetical protein